MGRVDLGTGKGGGDMAELYVKPGNREKGWNDPPQFSYGLQNQPGSGKRTALNKRVPVPLQGSPPAVPISQSLPSSTPPKMPPASLASSVGAPPTGQVVSPLRAEGVKQFSNQSESECDINVKDILAPLSETLDACKDLITKQVFNDISRRLKVLEEMWNSEKLSSPVRKRMSILVKELKCQNWDSADEIHRSLMVDHVTEVSQWMVGVKRLIAEARNLPEDHLVTKDETPEASCEHEVKQDK
ncbi:steroid receptor RNA activator 1 [Bombina bombina]|uniref:steroid receptor RNA activator 1 n=1 Tax=Bombina bombina TaxID=8345 RepID=UPI00235AC242|nr:steroid receptor RNA activator 1 [Bombina bombina]